MSTFDPEALLALCSIPGVGPGRMRALVGRFRTPEASLGVSLSELKEVEGIDQKTAHNILAGYDKEFVRRQMLLMKNKGTGLVSFWDEDFPANLKEIYDPPAMLFVRGTLNEGDCCAVAVVGTRRPTEYGRTATLELVGGLAARGVPIVSGMARGIDSVAHQGALKVGGRTMAVLGCGVDVVYPPENGKLAEEIVAHGAIISEYPMGTPPEAENFPRRNRIISGMSLGTIVVEAGEKSGALLTAKYALDQNREVFAVPGDISRRKSRGTNRLIKDGAKLVESVEDVLQELESKLKGLLEPPDKRPLKVTLVGAEKDVFEQLSGDPLHIDALSQQIQKSPGEVLATLLLLELKGLVRQLPGKMFVKC